MCMGALQSGGPTPPRHLQSIDPSGGVRGYMPKAEARAEWDWEPLAQLRIHYPGDRSCDHPS